MSSVQNMTAQELQIVQKQFRKEVTQVTAVFVATIGIMIAVGFIPRHFLFRTYNYSDNLLDHFGLAKSIIIIGSVCIGFTYFMYRVSNIPQLKRDVKGKIKHVAKLKVMRINHELGTKNSDITSELVFERNLYKIDTHAFNRYQNPEFELAKEVEITTSEFAKVLFGIQISEKKELLDDTSLKTKVNLF